VRFHPYCNGDYGAEVACCPKDPTNTTGQSSFVSQKNFRSMEESRQTFRQRKVGWLMTMTTIVINVLQGL
jgi:hypothetical protein